MACTPENKSDVREKIYSALPFSFYYHEENCVLSFTDLSLNFKEGNTYLIKGNNGSGKTTLLHLIAGFINKYHSPFPAISFYSPLIEVPAWLKLKTLIKSEKDNPRFLHYLKGFFSDSIPLEVALVNLSTGQRARVMLSLTLSKEANAYLLDEPFVFLDSHSKRVLIDIINKISKKNGKTVIITTASNIDDFLPDVTILIKNAETVILD